MNEWYALDHASPHRDDAAGMFNFSNALMMVLTRPLCGRVSRLSRCNLNGTHTHNNQTVIRRVTTTLWVRGGGQRPRGPQQGGQQGARPSSLDYNRDCRLCICNSKFAFTKDISFKIVVEK